MAGPGACRAAPGTAPSPTAVCSHPPAVFTLTNGRLLVGHGAAPDPWRHVFVHAVPSSLPPRPPQVTKSCLASYARGGKAGGRWSGALEHLNHPLPLPPPIASMAFAVYTLRRAEATLLPRLAAAIAASAAEPGATPFAAFTAHQVAADAVARVHTQLLLLVAFMSATGTGGGGGGGGGTARVPRSLRPLLNTLGTLHALAVVDDNAALLRVGALSPADAAAVHDAIDGLCTALRPHAAELAAVMTVPDFLLAPIAFDVVAHNSRARL